MLPMLGKHEGSVCFFGLFTFTFNLNFLHLKVLQHFCFSTPRVNRGFLVAVFFLCLNITISSHVVRQLDLRKCDNNYGGYGYNMSWPYKQTIADGFGGSEG